MTDNIGESGTTATTFRFASGQILTLDEDQIEKISYLAAIVSSADRFDSARDEDGHYKLDPHIDYKHLSFVLESLSFHSVRQLFTCLPKQNDVIPLIALLDFLGIGPQPDPTLNEVDSIFFSTLVYSPLLGKYLQIVRPSVIQDMAVRFAIAMAKEEYDFTDRKVIDQIYWFIMFILSAYELFGPRLRHHVYQIAEHCFSLFKPSLLKPLNKLILRTKKDARKLILTTNDENVDPDEENKRHLEQLTDLGWFHWSYDFDDSEDQGLRRRQELLLYRTYRKYRRFWYREASSEQDLLEPVCKRVLEIMYERLQSEICQRAIAEIYQRPKAEICQRPKAEIQGRNSVHELLQKRRFLLFPLEFFEREVLPKRIDDVLKSELVQEEIRERILEEICVLTPKLEKRRVELVKEIQEYEQNREILHENNLYFRITNRFYRSDFEIMQEEALDHELILDKLYQGSNTVVEQIQQHVLDELCEVARQQFTHWKRTKRDIDEFYIRVILCQSSEKSPSNTSKTMHQHNRIRVNKPLPKRQLKYSTR